MCINCVVKFHEGTAIGLREESYKKNLVTTHCLVEQFELKKIAILLIKFSLTHLRLSFGMNVHFLRKYIRRIFIFRNRVP